LIAAYKKKGFFGQTRKKPQRYRGIARIFDAVSPEKTTFYAARRVQHYTSGPDISVAKLNQRIVGGI
jgi:hypothetical protein